MRLFHNSFKIENLGSDFFFKKKKFILHTLVINGEVQIRVTVAMSIQD